MKTQLAAFLIFIIPIFSIAQNEKQNFIEVEKRIADVASSCKLNEETGVFQINLKDDNFELLAVDNKAQPLWKTQFKGNGITCGKFKGYILAIADSCKSTKKGPLNPYYAYLVDPLTGKTVLEREIFNQKGENNELVNSFFSNNGNDFNLVVRRSNRDFGFFSSYKDKTIDLTIINLNEKLEPIYIKPHFPVETFVSLTCNTFGDLFLLSVKDAVTLIATRFEHGTTEPSKPINLKCEFLEKMDLVNGINSITASEKDRNVLYLALAHNNLNDDRELSVASFNFTTGSSISTKEIFDSKHINELEKSYDQFDKSFGKPNIGSQKKQLIVKFFKQQNDYLIAVMSENYYIPSKYSFTYVEKAQIINFYDSNLKLKFQQLMPVYRQFTDYDLNNGFGFEGNTFNVVANNRKNFTNNPVYGQINLLTGSWTKLELTNPFQNYNADENIIMLKNSLIVPFFKRPEFFSADSYNLGLQSIGF
jgi:hypothetical protein